MEDVDELIHKFREYKLTHPNISHFWITYLEFKKKNIEHMLNQGHSVISQIEKSKDIEPDDLINMLMIKMII